VGLCLLNWQRPNAPEVQLFEAPFWNIALGQLRNPLRAFLGKELQCRSAQKADEGIMEGMAELKEEGCR
jgi:hypothetical protein